MAYVQYPVPNIEPSIVKPIMVQVLEKIKQDVFNDRDMKLILLDHTGSSMEIGSTLTNKGDNPLLLEESNKIIAVTSELVMNDILMSTVVDSDEMDTIWSDSKLAMYCKPTRVRTEASIQLTYKADTRQAINNWIHAYYNRLARGVSFTNIDVAYEITLPDEILAIMLEVFNKRETNAPYGDSFLEYLVNNANTQPDFKNNILGKGTNMVFRELLEGLSISVSNEVPEPTRGDSGNYEATIEVKFYYDKPTTIVHYYPIFVHSNYINPDMFNVNLDRNKEHIPRARAGKDLFSTLTYLQHKQQGDVYTSDGIIIPSFDDVKLNHSPLQLAPVIQLQLGVESTDQRLLLDLNLLEVETGMELHPQLLDYIKEVGTDVFTYGHSAICISVFKGKERLNSDKYYVDDNLQLRSNYDLDLRGNYHITICVLHKMHVLNKSAMAILTKYGDLATALIQYIHPQVKEVNLPKLQSNKVRNTIEEPVVVPEPDKPLVDDVKEANLKSLYNAIEALPQMPKVTSSRMYLLNTIVINV